MHSRYNKGKSILAKRFVRNLKNKIYKHMTSMSQKVFIDKIVDKVNKYNNTYHSAIKLKSSDVTVSTYCNFGFKSNECKVSQL